MATIVQHVHHNFVVQMWPKVVGYITDALQYSHGEYTAEQLKVMLIHGQQSLLVADADGEILGACTVVFENYPNDRVAVVTAIGGRHIALPELWAQLKFWVKTNGGTKIRGQARESIARLWRRKFGMQEVYRIVEISL